LPDTPPARPGEEQGNGMGCQCGACCEAQCGCGVNWTDPEVYRLRNALAVSESARQAAVLDALAAHGQAQEALERQQAAEKERDRDCAEMRRFQAEHIRMSQRLATAREALRRYGLHDQICEYRQGHKCTCGLTAALAAIGEGEVKHGKS
jgi:hypothetical protein